MTFVKIYLFLFYAYGYSACTYACAPSDPLGLELQMFVSYHVDVWNCF